MAADRVLDLLDSRISFIVNNKEYFVRGICLRKKPFEILVKSSVNAAAGSKDGRERQAVTDLAREPVEQESLVNYASAK
ncbi:MAG: hypothetical protein UZ17_ACD001001899 [Acidobacteria bacterium OLB17]|nr:MAG: hypothetical protein UZ17_ACD001001899 [Acidobacteria bacterium OLB17]